MEWRKGKDNILISTDSNGVVTFIHNSSMPETEALYVLDILHWSSNVVIAAFTCKEKN